MLLQTANEFKMCIQDLERRLSELQVAYLDRCQQTVRLRKALEKIRVLGGIEIDALAIGIKDLEAEMKMIDEALSDGGQKEERCQNDER